MVPQGGPAGQRRRALVLFRSPAFPHFPTHLQILQAPESSPKQQSSHFAAEFTAYYITFFLAAIARAMAYIYAHFPR